MRFTVRATNSGGEPCLDELEVYGPDGTNVASAAAGAVPSASGTLPGYEIHQLKHVNDGRYGNDHSWISSTPGTGWVELAFPAPVVVNRVVWGRDRQQGFADRLAVDYVIEVAEQPGDWHEVSSSADRQPYAGQPSLQATLTRCQRLRRKHAAVLQRDISSLDQRINELSGTIEQAWIGTFQQPPATHRLYRGDPMSPAGSGRARRIDGVGFLGHVGRRRRAEPPRPLCRMDHASRHAA